MMISRSEQSEDPLRVLLEEEGAADAAALETAEAFRLLSLRIRDALDTAGAPRLWDPDDDTTDKLCKKHIADLLDADATLGHEQAALYTFTRTANEIYVTSRIMLAMIDNETPGIPAHDLSTTSKKVLSAQLFVLGLEPEWQTALDSLLPGETLNPEDSEEDRLILLDEWLHQTGSSEVTLGNQRLQSLYAIFKNSPTSPQLLEVATELCRHALELQHNPKSQPNFESYLDECVRNGHMDQATARAVRQALI